MSHTFTKLLGIAALIISFNVIAAPAQAAVLNGGSPEVVAWWWIPYYIPPKPFNPADDPCWREPHEPLPQPNPYECPDHGPHTYPPVPTVPVQPAPCVPDGFPSDPCDH